MKKNRNSKIRSASGEFVENISTHFHCKMSTASQHPINILRSHIEGSVVLPGDPAYEEARRIWNAMFDRKPAAIVRCKTEADVVQSVNFARDTGLRLSIRGGGHNIAGYALCDRGLAIDFSGMRAVQIDAANRRALVEAGRVAPDATAYGNRDANFVMNVHGRWETRAEDEKCIAWARDFFQACAPFATGGAYINFLTAEEDARVRQGFAPNYPRLAQVKKKYDPSNLFQINQNIRPGVTTRINRNQKPDYLTMTIPRLAADRGKRSAS